MEHFIERSGVPSLFFFILLGMSFGENGIFRIPFDDYQAAETVCAASLIFIMFYGGFGTNLEEARPTAGKAVLLSTLGVAMTAGLVGLFVHTVLGLAWLESLLIGSVIASTDAASVFNILRARRLGLKDRTASLLELESGSNDPMSYMLTAVMLKLLTGGAVSVPLLLLRQIGFGVLCGAAIGLAAVWMLGHASFGIEAGKTIFVVAAAVLAYALPSVFGGNGYLSVYLCGIFMGNAAILGKRELVRFFDALTGMAQMLIFFLLGLLVTPVRLPLVILPALLIMLFMTFCARPLAVFAILLPFRAPLRQMLAVSWAGLRGAASIVFAIMAVLSGVPMRYNLYDLVFCMVLFSISVQGSLLPFVCRKLGLIDQKTDVRRTFNDYQEETDICFVKAKISQGHPYTGRKIAALCFPPEFLVAMILRGEEKLVPNGETVIQSGDLLVLAAPAFTEGENLKLTERVIARGGKWDGMCLRELKIPPGELVVTVRRKDRSLIADGATRIEAGDILVIARSEKRRNPEDT